VAWTAWQADGTRNSSPHAIPSQPNRRAKIPVCAGSALLLDQTTTKLLPPFQATCESVWLPSVDWLMGISIGPRVVPEKRRP